MTGNFIGIIDRHDWIKSDSLVSFVPLYLCTFAPFYCKLY